MSEQATTTPEQVLIHINPDVIVIPDITNVRPYSVANVTEDELNEMELLAESMDKVQIEPIVVRLVPGPTPEYDKYELIAGRRRVAAAQHINSGRKTGDEYLIAAIVRTDVSDEEAFRMANIENLKRKNMSPLDFAQNIATVRAKGGKSLKGSKGTELLADYFDVSEATIIQHEKLNGLDDDLKARLHSGEIKMDGALALMKVKPENRGTVLEGAKQEQASEEARTTVVTGAPGKTKTKAKAKPAKKKAVSARHIKKAARQADPNAVQSRSKKDLVEFFDAFEGPTTGHPNGAVHSFVRGFREYANGKLGDKAMEKLFLKMVEKADKGTPSPVEPPKVKATSVEKTGPKPAPKAAKKKAAPKKKK